MVNTLEPDLGRSGAYKWPMTQLAIIRAFSPYLLRSPKMVDSGSAYKYQSKTYDFLLYTYIRLSRSFVAHFICDTCPACPMSDISSDRWIDCRLGLAWPGLWTGLDWTRMDRWFMLFMLPRYGYGLNDCKTSLSFVAARLGYWYNYEV